MGTKSPLFNLLVEKNVLKPEPEEPVKVSAAAAEESKEASGGKGKKETVKATGAGGN